MAKKHNGKNVFLNYRIEGYGIKLRLLLVAIVFFNCGCANISVKPPVAFCEKQLLPQYDDSGTVKIQGSTEIKDLLAVDKESSNNYNSYEAKKVWAFSLNYGGIALLAAGICTASYGILSIPASGNMTQSNDFAVYGGLLAIAIGLLAIPFSGWESHDANNDLIKGIYEYNHECNCRNNKDNNKDSEENFYYPQFNFSGSVDFVGICNNERFSPYSDKAASVFANIENYQESLEKFSVNEAFSPVSMNEAFSLLDKVNAGCCK